MSSQPGKSKVPRASVIKQMWELKLYVLDEQPRSQAAVINLNRLCAEHLKGQCHIEVIDLLKTPEAAKRDQVVAIPSLRKIAPKPEKLLVGDFSKAQVVLKGLGIEQ